MFKFKELVFLKNLKGVGKVTIYNSYWKILNEMNSFEELIFSIEKIQKFSKEDIKKAIESAENLYEYIFSSDINVITVFDENYPNQLLKMGNKRPLILFIKGNADALSKPNIAIIGTRNPSKLSEKFEKEVVKNILNSSGRVVVSGLALGCDKIAHKTTVDENKATIAILPTGVNVITPASNKKLAEEIIATGGCLVSEYLPDAKAFKRTYVERDKIVAAFSDATFVVECGVKSGTMHTVDAAFEYNKTIFSFLPNDYLEGTYDGNEFILNNRNAIKVDNINGFLKDLKKMSSENKENSNNISKSIQPTLDSF